MTARTSTPATLGAPEAPGSYRFPSAEIDARMNTLVETIPLAGIALGIRYKDATYERGYGVANLASRDSVTDATVFKIASLTKSFTAAAVLHLAEKGRLSLDDPISRFFPQTPAFAENVLVRHLLTHTSGFPEWSVDAAGEALPQSFSTAEAVDYYFHSLEQLEFEPGTSWSYNNIGYFLLGAIIENVTGMSYDEYLRIAFFEPLELDSTYDCTTGTGALPTGYHWTESALETARSSNLEFLAAAGALCSNVGDLLEWLDALPHHRAIRPESWDQMITPAQLPDGEMLEYGFGLGIQETDEGPFIVHEGATAGFNSYFIYYPQQELLIVLLTNTDGFDPDLRSIARSLVEVLLR